MGNYNEIGFAQHFSSNALAVVESKHKQRWLAFQGLFSATPLGAFEARLAIVFQQRGGETV